MEGLWKIEKDEGMSKKIKKVTMNGVDLFLRDGKWSTITGRLVIYDSALEPTLKDGMITVEYEPEMVRCDHWGAPGCFEECPCYSDHEHTSDFCDGGCEAGYPQRCIPNAPGCVDTHPKPVEPKVDEVEEIEEVPIEEHNGNLMVYGATSGYNIQCDVRFRGYKFADGYIGTSLWRRIGGFGNEIEHAVSVLMAKGLNATHQARAGSPSPECAGSPLDSERKA